MRPIERGLSDHLAIVDAAPRLPLHPGFITREPLTSLFKVERTPPPIHLSLGSGLPVEFGAAVVRPAVSTRQKLADADFRLGLSDVVINYEDALARSGDEAAKAGLYEVCQFLNHCDHLSLLHQY